MTDNVTHLDADKRSDVVHYQRVVMGNYIRLLEEAKANFVALAAEHDAWTAQLQQEARQPPKDEEERYNRVGAFLSQREEFQEDLRDLDYFDRLSVMAGRSVPKPDRKSAAETRPPRPPLPEWVATADGGANDIHGNFRVEHTRCATAHLDYYTLLYRCGDHWSSVAEKITLEAATSYADDMVVRDGWWDRGRWVEETQ